MVQTFIDDNYIRSYYNRAITAVEQALRQMDDRTLLANEEQDLVDALAGQWFLEHIEEDPNRPPSAAGVPERETNRGGGEVLYATVDLYLIPKASNEQALQLRASEWRITGYRIETTFRSQDHILRVRTYI